jgi:hypothetical protein
MRTCFRKSSRWSLSRTQAVVWWAALTLTARATSAVAQDSVSPGPAVPPGAQEPLPQTHTVKKGDTLWDLAQFYFHDPFLWPGIYRINTDVVEDPHWIYPGEILRIAPTGNIASVPTMDTPVPPSAGDSATMLADAGQGGDSTGVPGDTADGLSPGPQQPSIAESDDQQRPLFPERRARSVSEILRSYTHQEYRPLRRSEFYSSGFLTEKQRLPYGKVIGPVTPQQIKAVNERANALPFSSISVAAPSGATYQLGDSLLLLQLGHELDDYGHIVVPTGVVRIIQVLDDHYIADIVATYGPIRNGQRTLPLERFSVRANARAVPVSDGVRGSLIGGLGRQNLKEPQMVVFINKGREDGVAPGDLFEVRRRPGRSSDGMVRINELMATMQIVHVRDHTATGLLLTVISPDIPPGTDVMQVAKLPS